MDALARIVEVAATNALSILLLVGVLGLVAIALAAYVRRELRRTTKRIVETPRRVIENAGNTAFDVVKKFGTDAGTVAGQAWNVTQSAVAPLADAALEKATMGAKAGANFVSETALPAGLDGAARSLDAIKGAAVNAAPTVQSAVVGAYGAVAAAAEALIVTAPNVKAAALATLDTTAKSAPAAGQLPDDAPVSKPATLPVVPAKAS